MKILIANLPSDFNRFVADLKEGMERHAEVVWDYEEFWKCENHFDVIHLHWPEYLSHEIQNCTLNTNPISTDLWEKTIRCLNHWKQTSTIIYTRHNQHPHLRHDQEILDFYRDVVGFSDTAIHFSNYSIRQFKQLYPQHSNVQHLVIPHHNYASLPNASTKQEARFKLGIDPMDKVMVVFGAIRENEKWIIEEAFDAVPSDRKLLLAPGWKVPRQNISYIRLREAVWNIEKWLLKFQRQQRLNLGFIPDTDAHYYLNAADVMLIPRTYELNSGNIALGFTFGLVVVGRNSGNIGELLRQTGNPTFEIGSSVSLRGAISRAFELYDSGLGERNREVAATDWEPTLISKMYIDAMKYAIANKFGA